MKVHELADYSIKYEDLRFAKQKVEVLVECEQLMSESKQLVASAGLTNSNALE